jgi:polyisoprenoid-binding protein YceI
MKNTFLPLLAAAALLASCGEPSQPEAPAGSTANVETSQTGLADGIYVINKVKPKVTWAAQKLTGEGHNGNLHIESGKFRIENGGIVDGVVVFDMARIEVTDLTGESKENLEGHLRSGDFFNVEAHPKAVLKVNAVQSQDGVDVLNGTLTMNGEAVDYSIPVQLVEAEVPGNQKGVAIQGKFKLDRTKHNITYHSQTFDDKLDWFIKDDVMVGFSVIGVPAN